MRLFVAGNEANSVKAMANLEQICKDYLGDDVEYEVIDVIQDFQTALESGVLVTPELVVTEPVSVKIAGTLSDTAKVLAALQAG
jgi:circadian clock protein KaiB